MITLGNPYNSAKLSKVAVKGEGMRHVETLHDHFACTISETPILIMELPEYLPGSGDIFNGDMLYPGHVLLP